TPDFIYNFFFSSISRHTRFSRDWSSDVCSSDSPARAPAPAPAPVPAPASASATGTLNINAVPRASVILDGKPIGSTPKIGVSVSAGNHSVIFVKDGERVTKSVTVQGGGSATVVHRF